MTGPSSERTAEDRYPLPWTCPHGIDGRNCVKCADAYHRARSGAQKLVIDEAARVESKQKRETSERTADADVETLRRLMTAYAMLRRSEDYDWSQEGHAALDRLVARNQQLQEALAALCEAAADLLVDDDMPNHWDDCVCSYCTRNRALRAALASVRARTPQ